jgi:hypothetical protein
MERVKKPPIKLNAAVQPAKPKRRRPRKVEYSTMEEALEQHRQQKLRDARTYDQRTEAEVEKELIDYKTRGYWRFTELPRALKKMLRAESFEQFLRRDLSGLHPDAEPRDKRLFKEFKRQQQRTTN